MTPSGKLKPLMAYLGEKEYAKLKKFSKAQKMPMSMVVREAINARVVSGDRYVTGWNDAVDAAVKQVHGLVAAQMRFPSGKSFAELIEEALTQIKLSEAEDETA